MRGIEALAFSPYILVRCSAGCERKRQLSSQRARGPDTPNGAIEFSQGQGLGLRCQAEFRRAGRTANAPVLKTGILHTRGLLASPACGEGPTILPGGSFVEGENPIPYSTVPDRDCIKAPPRKCYNYQTHHLPLSNPLQRDFLSFQGAPP